MEIFSEKKSFRNLGPRKFFPFPQTRRQVSATDRGKCRNFVEIAGINYTICIIGLGGMDAPECPLSKIWTTLNALYQKPEKSTLPSVLLSISCTDAT